MPIDAAITFDRKKDFKAFFAAEPVGSVKWLEALIANAKADGPFVEIVSNLLHPEANVTAIQEQKEALLAMGSALTAPFDGFSLATVEAQGLSVPPAAQPPMVQGVVRVVPTTKELGQRLVLNVGQREFPLVCNNDPLESFAGDLSAFAGFYEVCVVGWPDDAGQIHVQEAGPVMSLPGLTANDWAQGRLFDNGVVGGAVVLRINPRRQIQIDDLIVQDRLRPFIGTGVVLYGKRMQLADGSVHLSDLDERLWFLTRLTNPPDRDAGYPGAPRPKPIDDRCLCIGATPPWNWSGPNIETHIIAPANAAALVNTEERRVVYGRPATALPPGWTNPVASLTRVIEVYCCAEPFIEPQAHWATRLAPRGKVIESLRGIVELTSAERAFAA